MTILFRYILREYAKVFLMCFAGLMTVYLVVDFFEKVRKFMRYDAELGPILMYFALRTPSISFQLAPLALLMATLLTLGLFLRNREIIAMRACGISLSRIASPFLAFALAVSLALLGMTAVVIPIASLQADVVKTVLIERKPNLAAFKGDRRWVQTGNRSLMNITFVDPDGATLRGITLYHLSPAFELAEIIEATKAVYTDRGWMLQTGQRRTLLPGGAFKVSPFETWMLSLSQTPKDFSAWVSKESEEMTFDEIRSYVQRLRHDGYSFARMLTDYYGRIAFPFVGLVMAIVGIALSLSRPGSRAGGGLAIGIGQALVIGFLYWTTHSVAIALGRSGRLAPMLGPDFAPLMAGWIANVIFLSFAGFLLLRVRH